MKDIESVKTSIKASATELFATVGYEKTTLEDIAAHAGKAKTSIYYHFDGKKAVFKAVIEDELLCVRRALQLVRDMGADGVVAQLIKYLEKRMELLCSASVYRKYFFYPYSQPSSEISQIVKSFRDEFDKWEGEYFNQVCLAGLEASVLSSAVKPAAFAQMLIMVLKGLEVQFFTTGDLEATRSTYSEVLERLLLGMCN